MSRDTVLTALDRLATRLEQRGVAGEINLLGGTAMMLGFQARQSTRDVDAVFAPATIIREEAAEVAVSMGLPESWLNDAVKGFVSPHGEFRDLAEFDRASLRVQVPTAEYLLAMKVLAARVDMGAGAGDKEDIRFLIRWLELDTVDQVMDIVQRYYDPSRMLPRSLYLVEEILAEEKSG